MLNIVREAKSRTKGQCQIPPLVRGEDEADRESRDQAEALQVVILAILAEAHSMPPMGKPFTQLPSKLLFPGVSRPPLTLMIR